MVPIKNCKLKHPNLQGEKPKTQVSKGQSQRYDHKKIRTRTIQNVVQLHQEYLS
jgi:hypothetical protein